MNKRHSTFTPLYTVAKPTTTSKRRLFDFFPTPVFREERETNLLDP